MIRTVGMLALALTSIGEEKRHESAYAPLAPEHNLYQIPEVPVNANWPSGLVVVLMTVVGLVADIAVMVT